MLYIDIMDDFLGVNLYFLSARYWACISWVVLGVKFGVFGQWKKDALFLGKFGT